MKRQPTSKIRTLLNSATKEDADYQLTTTTIHNKLNAVLNKRLYYETNTPLQTIIKLYTIDRYDQALTHNLITKDDHELLLLFYKAHQLTTGNVTLTFDMKHQIERVCKNTITLLQEINGNPFLKEKDKDKYDAYNEWFETIINDFNNDYDHYFSE